MCNSILWFCEYKNFESFSQEEESHIMVNNIR